MKMIALFLLGVLISFCQAYVVFADPLSCFFNKEPQISQYATNITVDKARIINILGRGYGVTEFKNFNQDKEKVRSLIFNCGCTVFDDSKDKVYGVCSTI